MQTDIRRELSMMEDQQGTTRDLEEEDEHEAGEAARLRRASGTLYRICYSVLFYPIVYSMVFYLVVLLSIALVCSFFFYIPLLILSEINFIFALQRNRMGTQHQTDRHEIKIAHQIPLTNHTG